MSSAKISTVPTALYADSFIGGRGIATKIYWDGGGHAVNALDPENQLILMTGPLAGISGVAGSRWEISGKSPIPVPEQFSHSNLGGHWGAWLKFAGYDGIVIQGKSETPVYLLVREGTAELKDAAHLWGKNTLGVQSNLKDELGNTVRVVTTGPAGDNQVPIAAVIGDSDSCGCGFGAVMGAKGLKAVAVVGRGKRPAVARPEQLHELTKYLRELRLTQALRFFYGRPLQWMQPEERIKQQICYGCISGCNRSTYELADGEKVKFHCQASQFYDGKISNYYGEPRREIQVHATRLCNRYGIDTKAVTTLTEWLSRCYQAGILDEKKTGIPLAKVGSLEFIETLLEKITRREGFGDILAHGVYYAADAVGGEARGLITDYVYKAGQINSYGARMYLTTGLLYAMAPRQPIQQLHQVVKPVMKWKNRLSANQEGAYMTGEVLRAIGRRFWGSELAVDFSTYAGKALAAKMVQDREFAKECLILCDEIWPVMDMEHSADHVGDPTLESKVYTAVTGNDMDEEGFYRLGEKVFNLQRAIFIREGHRGRPDDRLAEFNYTVPQGADWGNPDCLVPGKDGKPISRKGAVVDRGKFEEMLDEYYQLRGWDTASGLQMKAKLKELQLEDVADDLAKSKKVV